MENNNNDDNNNHDDNNDIKLYTRVQFKPLIMIS